MTPFEQFLLLDLPVLIVFLVAIFFWVVIPILMYRDYRRVWPKKKGQRKL